jgi:beta-glucosidase
MTIIPQFFHLSLLLVNIIWYNRDKAAQLRNESKRRINMKKAVISPPMSDREIRNAAVSRRVACEGMVLLQNKNSALPLGRDDKRVAFFGLGAVRTVRGGTGSGDPFNGGLSGGAPCDVNQSPRYHVNILDSFVNAGFEVVTESMLRDYAVGYDREMQKVAGNPMIVFTYPEIELDEKTVSGFSSQTDIAIYVLSRNAGEGMDRTFTKKIKVEDREYEVGDYSLSEVEKENLRLVTETFKRTILVLNIGGVIDMKYISGLEKLDSILLMSQAGQEGGDALLDVLTGKVTPSGKLTDTWAAEYADYPASATFAYNDNNVDVEKYTEGIYVGYRYFDSFGKTPIYPFGFGLSYTTFDTEFIGQAIDGDRVTVSVKVTNTGSRYSGKEVVQVYCSAPEVRIEKPYQELIGFAKTKLLALGESEILKIGFRISDLASYDFENSCYTLEKGDYRIRTGTSSRNTKPAFILRLEKDVTTRLVYHELPLSQPLEEISRFGKPYGLPEGDWSSVPVCVVDPDTIPCVDSRSKYHDETVITYTTDRDYKPLLPYEKVEYKEKRDITLIDVAEGRATLEDLVAQLSIEELAELNCGIGWGVQNEDSPIVGSNSATIAGAAGETTSNLWDKYKIPSIVVADGPAGVRVNQQFEATNIETGEKVMRYQYCTSWPVGTLLAQSFDLSVVEEVGKGISEELAELGIAIVLGPGMNIHRDPLCGRNFEYFSEDPFLTGHISAAYVRGVQTRSYTGACIKHYAVNNQESNRAAYDPIVSERALREIYLRCFEITIKESKPMSIMTAYNLVNGVMTAESYDLCTDFARGEWGFDGLIMTDWNGGRETYRSIHAGNDLIMPGGSGKIRSLVLAATLKPPVFDERGQIEFFEEKMFITLLVPNWKSFNPDPDGKEIAEAVLGEGYTAVVKDDMILVNGEPLYMEHIPDVPPRFRKPGTEPGFAHPVTTKDAYISDDGKRIYYRGTWKKVPDIAKGDLQRCAINNLKVIMRCKKMI